MDDEGARLSKKNINGGEVDYKSKAGTAWSHSFLNQKPWHPLSYPNQRRKWIAEQTNAQHQRRAQEVAREVCYYFLSQIPNIYSIHLLLCFICVCLCSMLRNRSFFVKLHLFPRKTRKK